MKTAALTMAILACLWVAPATATTTYRVDDTGTMVSQAMTPMRWRKPVPGRVVDNTLEGRVSVALRLNLSQWTNRPARIYMGLAPTDGEQLVATWRTQGRLLPGSVRSGGRTLVFEGIVRDAFLQETIVMDLLADGRTLERPQSLQFFFEIDTTP